MLSPLRRGRKYFEAFPDSQGIRIGNAIEEWRVFGIPDPVLVPCEARFPAGDARNAVFEDAAEL